LKARRAVAPIWALAWMGVRVANSPIGARFGFAD
jgi:hypothetical protein